MCRACSLPVCKRLCARDCAFISACPSSGSIMMNPTWVVRGFWLFQLHADNFFCSEMQSRHHIHRIAPQAASCRCCGHAASGSMSACTENAKALIFILNGVLMHADMQVLYVVPKSPACAHVKQVTRQGVAEAELVLTSPQLGTGPF